ncbi:hypothetical protein DUZ99_02260 [Xylanibacillus composti]|uniref:Uncharacterized protein n=1 Tax=Xylanibacillus composti TaxID=1572762 RepID=A0A8J4H0P6_9BACL|nr:hypothetical protein [Xylanibacillus composti]MDT9723819.1 hypothetical protein [Xylanibacillus composti]GIQ67405.1 hypothetical protein XYCOK13_02290 [Xylanibacillus composti]
MSTNPLELVLQGKTQQEVAKHLHLSRSAIGMAATGRRKIPDECEPKLARMNWRAALQIASERSGGYIGNILDTYSNRNIDFHPASLIQWLIAEMTEAKQTLGGLVLAKMDPQKKKAFIEEMLMELEDVSELIDGMKGTFAEEFGIDLYGLLARRKQMIADGQR